MRWQTPLLIALSAALGGCATTSPMDTSPVQAPLVAHDQRPKHYQPTRVAPSAMEAWIAPWEDASGDLYPPSTVYIEVTPERWQYGNEDRRLTVLRPLQVKKRTTVTADDAPSVPAASFSPAEGSAPTPFAAPSSVMRGT